MRDNRVKQALRSGGVSMGVMCLEFATTGIGPLSAAGSPMSRRSRPWTASMPSGSANTT